MAADDLRLAEIFQAGEHGLNTAWFRGCWNRYAGGVWEPKNEYSLKMEILRVMQASDGIRSTGSKLRSIETILRSVLFIPDELIDAKPDLINLQGGVYDIDKGELISPDRKYYMTTQLPFEYNPEATAPLWGKFLSSTFVFPYRHGDDPQPDNELITFLQQAVGYSLTTDNSQHVTFFNIGRGANGKGVIFHIIAALAGESAIPLNIGLLGREQYQLAQLAGKKVALCSETKKRNLLEDDLIKALVGGDPMNVRQIKKEPFILYPMVKLWLAGNSLPIVTDTSEGLWRRILAIPFNRNFYDRRRGIDDRILDLKERLEEELPGIFLWAMQGLATLRDRGKFLIPAQVAALTDGYRYRSNSIEMFLAEETSPVPSGSTTLVALYADYVAWARTNGFGQLSRTNFSAEVERLDFEIKSSNGGTMIVKGLQSARTMI